MLTLRNLGTQPRRFCIVLVMVGGSDVQSLNFYCSRIIVTREPAKYWSDDDTSRRVRSSMIQSHNLNTEVEIIMFVDL